MLIFSLSLVLSTLPGFEPVYEVDAGLPAAPQAAPAEVAAPTPAPQPVAAPVPVPVAAPAPAQVSAPDAGAPLTAQGVLDLVTAWVRPYAVFKPTIIVSSGAVESYSQPNASAVTAAANPVLATLPTEPRLTFQVAQSRAGLWLNEKGSVRGRFEIDFIDFAKASPTTASLVRLRLAYMEWQPTENFTLLAGQDWDLHSPVAPHTGNMVGSRFLSGNSGFMRQQVKAIGKVAGFFELAGAVGMEGVNITAKDAAFELSIVPTFALRGAWLVGKGGRVGVSGIGTSLRLNPGTTTERRAFAGGVTGFADFTLGTTSVRGEVTLGRNMANLGLLTLGLGGATDVDEWGGFVSLRHGLTPMHFVFVNAGLMRALNPAAVRVAYSYPAAAVPADGSPPAMKDAALAGTGPGITHNGGVNLGYELKLTKNLSFMLEGFFLYTEHKLLDVDAARVSGARMAGGAELSAFVSF